MSESITTHEIQQGDVIRSNGMLLLVDREVRQTFHPVTEYGGATFAADARVLNWEEVQETGDSLLVNFIRSDMAEESHRTRNGLQPFTEPRWTIQGNGIARWLRVGKVEL